VLWFSKREVLSSVEDTEEEQRTRTEEAVGLTTGDGKERLPASQWE
jgi:hypothetical protein